MKKGRTGRPLEYLSVGTADLQYFELPNIFWWLKYELSGNSGELELMPVSWADGMERYSCTGRDLLRRYVRCYPYSVIPSGSGELKFVISITEKQSGVKFPASLRLLFFR